MIFPRPKVPTGRPDGSLLLLRHPGRPGLLVAPTSPPCVYSHDPLPPTLDPLFMSPLRVHPPRPLPSTFGPLSLSPLGAYPPGPLPSTLHPLLEAVFLAFRLNVTYPWCPATSCFLTPVVIT